MYVYSFMSLSKCYSESGYLVWAGEYDIDRVTH